MIFSNVPVSVNSVYQVCFSPELNINLIEKIYFFEGSEVFSWKFQKNKKGRAIRENNHIDIFLPKER